MNKKLINDFWKNLTKEREALLSKIDLDEWKKWENKFEKKLIEKIFVKTIKKPFFKWDLLLNNRINFYIVVGNANIGKSYASRELILDYIKKGKRFIIMRSTKTELDNYKASLRDWLKENNLELKKDTIIEPISKSVVGFTIALSTSLNWKSSEFGNVELIVYDEFMKPNERLKNKLTLLTRLILTSQRQSKEFKVLLLSNYIKNDDDILVKMGFTNFEKSGDLVFNPLTKAMLWAIPSNVFREFKDEYNIGYILSLENKKAYAKNYGGSFTNNTTKNLLNKDWNIKNTKALFGLYFKNNFMLFSEYKDKIIVDYTLYEELIDLDVEIFTLDKNIYLTYRNVKLINYIDLIELAKLFYKELILVNGDIDIKNDLVSMFNLTLSYNKENKLFNKIEGIN